MKCWLRVAAWATALSVLSCGGKARGTAPHPPSSGGAPSMGGAPSAIVSEQHLLLAKGGLRAAQPDARWREGRLGVAYLIETRDSGKGLGISISRSRTMSDGFEEHVLAEPSARRALRLESDQSGYGLFWLESGPAPEALMLLGVDAEGQPRGAAREIARADAMQFDVASAGSTLAVAAMERVLNAWAVTVRLVTDSQVSAELTLDTCLSETTAPAVVWDGQAFDVMYVCAEPAPAAPRLTWVRVSETGEILGAPRLVTREASATQCLSLGLGFDRGALSLIYPSSERPGVAYFVRLELEQEGVVEQRSLQGTLPAGRLSIAATPDGYEVASTSCEALGSSSVSVTLCPLDLEGAARGPCQRIPTSSSVPRATALVAGPDGALFVHDEYSLSSRSVFVVPIPTDPLAELSPAPAVWPTGELHNRSLVCAGEACRLQSFRMQGRVRTSPARALEFGELGSLEALHVDLDTETVTTRSNSRLLPARTASVVQAAPDGPVALLDIHAFDASPSTAELVGLDGDLGELWAVPLRAGTPFAEAGGVRTFTNNRVEDIFVRDGSVVATAERNRRPVYDLAFCAGAYYDIDAERHTIYRLEPRDGAEFVPFATVPERNGWLKCTEGMVCAETSDSETRKWWCWDHTGNALPGAVFASYDSRSFSAFSVALGADLGLGQLQTQMGERISLTRLRPDGSTAEYQLRAPKGLQLALGQAVGDERNLRMVWNDPNTGDTYLSSWALR